MNWEEKYNALAALVDGYRRERDEARADCDSLRKQVSTLNRNCATHYDHGRQLRRWLDETIDQRDEARAELATLRKDYDSVLEANVGLLDGAPYVDARAAFRRGAEAMREACAREIVEGRQNSHEGMMQWFEDIASDVRDLPIPEDEP